MLCVSGAVSFPSENIVAEDVLQGVLPAYPVGCLMQLSAADHERGVGVGVLIHERVAVLQGR